MLARVCKSKYIFLIRINFNKQILQNGSINITQFIEVKETKLIVSNTCTGDDTIEVCKNAYLNSKPLQNFINNLVDNFKSNNEVYNFP